MSERHDLCRPSALISKDADIAKRIDQQMVDSSDGIDLIDAEEQAERDVLAEREEALAKELAEMRKRKRKLVDPLQYALSIAAEDLVGYVPTFAWEMAPPSARQLENEVLKGKILETMEPNRWYSIAEMVKEFLFFPTDITPQRCSALMSQLADAGKVKREVVKRKVLFCVCVED